MIERWYARTQREPSSDPGTALVDRVGEDGSDVDGSDVMGAAYPDDPDGGAPALI